MFKAIKDRIVGTNAAYKRLFATEDGKKVLADILARANYRKSLVSGDIHRTYAAAAKQELALEILAQIELSDAEVGKIVNSYKVTVNNNEEE